MHRDLSKIRFPAPLAFFHRHGGVLTTLTAHAQATAPKRVKISYTDPAYAGMPIWVTIDASLQTHYPVIRHLPTSGVTH